MIPFLDLKRQYQHIRPQIQSAIQTVLDSGRFIQGEQIKIFENSFACASGSLYAIGTSSGTSALHLALKTLGIGVGDEVITVPNTFIATTEAITQAGANIKFVDVDPRTYTLNVDALDKVLTPKTRAIIPVCLYGQPGDLTAVDLWAKKHGIKVVIDAAQAHLAEFNGKPLGKYGDAVCYSFFPGKNLGAYGDAGCITTNDEQLAKKMRMLADHGRTKKYEHEIEGYNYRLDEIQAAILNVKLKYLPEWTKKRRQIANMYDMLLKDLDITTPFVDPQAQPVYHLYVIRTPNREKIIQELEREGIQTGIHYPIPLHLQPAYQYLGYSRGAFPVAESLSQEVLSLPLFPELTSEEIQSVVMCLKKSLAKISTKEIHDVSR